MPSTSKANKKPKFQYSEEAMKQALQAVGNGLTCSEASRMFNVPRSTLVYKKTGKSPINRRMGPKCVLSEHQEQLLENWVKEMAKRGFPIVKWDLMSSVEKIVEEMNLKSPFTNGKPGKKWLALFLKRHPSISKRVVEKLTARRAAVSETDLRNWFHEIKVYLKDESYFDILQDPDRVFNADEAAFMLCPKSEKVLGIRGQKNVYEVTGNNDKESITVLVNANASGKVAPIMIVYPYVRLPPTISNSVPDEWCVGKSDKGWMNSENFFEYIANTFYPWLEETGIQLPIILFIDGHSSHLTLHLSTFCAEKGIILLSLFPNATHILQPLDVAVFRPLKLGWQKTVHAWKMQNLYQHLTKYNFAPLLERTIKEYLKKNDLIQGFRLCGLHPFNENAVDYTKCSTEPAATISTDNTKQNLVSSESGQLCSSHLEYLESKIDPAIITQFENSEDDIWKGELSYLQLFHVWLSFKKDYEKNKNRPVRDEDVLSVGDNLQASCSQIPDSSWQLGLTTPVKESPNAQTQILTSSENRREKLSQIICPTTSGKGVPTPFKKFLFWPGTPPKKKTFRNNAPKLPSAVTSKQWQEYFKKKKQEKEEKEKIKLERKMSKINKSKTKTATKKRKISSGSETEKENIPYSESDEETLEQLAQRYEREENEIVEDDDTQLQCGKWVLTELTTTKNTKKHYVGLIIGMEEQEVTVKFLKKLAREVTSNTSTFVWPEKDDIADISMSNILKALPEPTTGRRGEVSFSISFDGYCVF